MDKFFLILRLAAYLLFMQAFCVQGQTIPVLDAVENSNQSRNPLEQKIVDLYSMADSVIDQSGGSASDVVMLNNMIAQIQVLANKAGSGLARARVQLLRAKIFRITGNQAGGRELAAQAMSTFEAAGNSRLQADAIIEFGGTYSNSPVDLPSKIFWYKKGTAIIEQLGDRLKTAQLKEFIGDLLQVNREYGEALIVLQEGLALYKAIGFTRLHGIYSLIGECYDETDNFVEALRYNMLAQKTGEQFHDDGPVMLAIYNRMGIIYFGAEYWNESMDYFNKGIVIAKRLRDTADLASLLVNVAEALRMTNKTRESLDSLAVADKFASSFDAYEKEHALSITLKNYIKLQDNVKIREYGMKLQKMYGEPGFNETIRQFMRTTIVEYLQSQGRFRETLPLLQEFLVQKEKGVTAGTYRKIIFESIAFKTDSALGNLQGALTHYMNYKMLQDTIYKRTRAKQLDILRLQFETDQKNKNIEVLTQKSQLQAASLQREKVLRGVFIGGACMLLVLFALLYNRYRLKERTNLALEYKQEEINHQNDQLKKLVADKEWLLKEVHHRVKNNLQIVISLLNTQSQFLHNEDALSAIRTSQNRMHAMSLIHQQLYQDKEPGKIDMQWYIKSLMDYVKQAFHTGDSIAFILTSDKVLLDVAQAVPLGLIINEAVSNAIKYAFPDQRQGIIQAGIKETEKDTYVLLVSDNGAGIQHNQQLNENDSLGISLMRGLTDQLDGKFTLEDTGSGVTIKVAFTYNFFENRLAAT